MNKKKLMVELKEVERIIIDGVRDDTSFVQYKHLLIEQEETYRKLLHLSFD